MPGADAVSVEDLRDLHERVVNSPDGARPGELDAGALEAAVARPYHGFGGVEFYPSPFAKAAALMESIVQRHPFVDGNKRTGLLAAIFSLDLSGYALDAPDDEQIEISVETAEHRLDVEGLARWLEDRAVPSGAP